MADKTRRTWLRSLGRISLKMSLLLVALATVAMAFVADAWHQRQRELTALNQLHANMKARLVVERTDSYPLVFT
ncbi:MAG: hypothetical protein JNL67_03155 [Planctomycetaceae bacterium]|nr:hypothetical protein [Planctomycetaceae bacterium]